MADDAAQPATSDAGEKAGGLLGRIQSNAARLAHGRRLALPLPGYEDLGGGRGLWARFAPLSRAQQQQINETPNATQQELDAMAEMIALCCEEIEIGDESNRTPLAQEQDVIERFGMSVAPLRFDAMLCQILGWSGAPSDGAAVVKRMLIRSGDDLPLYAVGGLLLGWSSNMFMKQVEVAAGE